MLVYLILILLPGSTAAASECVELKVPSGVLEKGERLPKGWQPFQFGAAGNARKIRVLKLDDKKNKVAIGIAVAPGGGGHDVFTNIKLDESLAYRVSVEFSLKAIKKTAKSLLPGKIDVPCEQLAAGEIVARTDEPVSSKTIKQADLESSRFWKFNKSYELSKSDIPNLEKVDTLRQVIVVVQNEGDSGIPHGAIIADDFKPDLVPSKK